MDNWNLRTFRNDLSIFIGLIEDYSIGDFSQIHSLLGKLESMDVFEYNLDQICFYLNKRISGTIPVELNKYQIYLENMITLKDKFISTKDFISKYKFEIIINSYITTELGDGKCYKTCWHLDKHIDSTEPKYTHPIYHFHFGGEYLEGSDTGELSIFSTPRLPHPPMDIFLSFHFIMCNFFSSKEYPFVNELKNNPDYQAIIKRAQERLWKPYFGAFDSNNTNIDFTFKNVFPLYIN